MVAVVGPLADDAQAQLGDWAGSSGQVNWMLDGQPRDMITTVLDGLRAEAPEDWEVTYSRGADIVRLEPDPEGNTWPDGQPRYADGELADLVRALAPGEISRYSAAKPVNACASTANSARKPVSTR